MPAPAVILASGSRYRLAQLEAIGVRAQPVPPEVDESAGPGEDAATLAQRLAGSKAAAVAGRHPRAIVIAADQTVECAGAIYGKPGSAVVQASQLAACAGRELRFHTAVVVRYEAAGFHGQHLDTTRCRMRALTEDEIARYVAREPAIDCAGGCKVEGLGITLFDAIDSSDPSALVGLPLIAVARMLRACGMQLP
jgi:septum formation protein